MPKMSEHGHHIQADTSEQVYHTDHHAWRMTDHGAYLSVESPLLGEYPIYGRPEDALFTDLIRSPLGWRSFAITQLSKDVSHTTIPNTASFIRAGHVTDSREITHRLARDMDATDEQKLGWQIYAQVTDYSHGPFSHATDIVFEGHGGGERFHEVRMPDAFQHGGINRVLEQHNVVVDTNGVMPGIELPPWVECESPDINVDRFQYGPQELDLWFAGEDVDPRVQEAVKNASSLDNITILDDGRMAFRDIESARVFSKGYLLLGTEHWNDPVNRVQLHLLIETIKRSIIKRRLPFMDDVDLGVTRNPESYSYAIDADVIEATRTRRGHRDDFMYAVRSLLSAIGKQERERFIEYKREQYAQFLLDDQAIEYPSEILNDHLVDFGPPSTHVEISVIKVGDEVKGRQTAAQLVQDDVEGIKYHLPPLKNRYVDPPVLLRNGTSKRLSELDPNFARIKDEHQAIQAASLSVRLVLAKDFEEGIRNGITANAIEFEEKRKDRSLSPDQLRHEIEGASQRARDVAVKAGHLVLRDDESK